MQTNNLIDIQVAICRVLTARNTTILSGVCCAKLN